MGWRDNSKMRQYIFKLTFSYFTWLVRDEYDALEFKKYLNTKHNNSLPTKFR